MPPQNCHQKWPSAVLKWDEQTSHRFTALRTSLQHALIDSTLPASASSAAITNHSSLPFSPTRAAATSTNISRTGQYYRSQSESANQTTATTTITNNNVHRGSHAVQNKNGNNVGSFPFTRSHSSPTNKNDGVLPPPSLGRSVSSNITNLQRGHNVNTNNNKSATNSMRNHYNNNDTLGLFNGDKSINQFHTRAICALLSDTPLPLAIVGSGHATATTTTTDDIEESGSNDSNNSGGSRIIIQPRKPRHNEHIYLLPRVYMRQWCEWTRNDVLMSCIDTWLSTSSSSLNCNNDGNDEVFELPHDGIKTLASLSLISDQYQLFSDDESENDKEWMRWWKSVETCWSDWMQCVHSQQLLVNSPTSNNNGGQYSDEKKEDGVNSINTGIIQAGQLFRDMFQSSHPEYCPPGPMNAILLTKKGRPLELRRAVSLVMRGMNDVEVGETDIGSSENVLTVQQEMCDETLIKYLDSLDIDEDTPHLAVSPVPSSFYELLRQTLGVICEDGRTVSFQPSVAVKNGNEDGSSLLHHDQWKNDATSTNGNSKVAKRNMDIHYPTSPTGGSMDVAPTSPQAKIVRPIEFRRRLLPLPSSSRDGKSVVKSSTTETTTRSYAALLKDTAQSKNESQSDSNKHDRGTKHSVEVHPIEFHYSIIDGVSSPLSAAATNPKSLQHCQKGMALASRASLAKTVLHELEHAASPGQSSACIRLWMKSRPIADSNNGVKGATKNGDGFDLIDINSLVISSTKKPISPPLPGKKSTARPLTVGEWLKIDQAPLQTPNSSPIVVELLIEIRSSPTAQWTRESFELGNRLQVGDFVDAQDSTLQWYEAIVREVTPDTVKVHYFGWGSKWDTVLPRRLGAREGPLKNKSPPVPLWSKTSRWREQIKVGDEVEVRESSSLVQRPKWHRGTVIAVGRESDTPRELVGGAELEALEDNGNGKKVPLLLLNRKTQVLVDVPQEKLKCNSPLPTVKSKNDEGLPTAKPPFIRWINLYSEEICQVNTHKTSVKQQSDAPVTASYVMESKRDLVEVMKPFNNIHGSGFVRESLRGNPIASGTVGLHNLGNSCYMNSILQCLNQIKPITDFFLKGDYLKEMNKNNPLGSGGRISTAYSSFLNDVWGSEYSILAPRLLKQTVGSFAPQFNNNFQHDSHEFCQFLMDGLHEDLNRVKNKPYVEQMEAYGMKDRLAAEESWRNHLKRHDSIFVDYTQGLHRSHLRCPGCGRESVKFDVYSSISLPLVPPKSGSTTIPLKDCLDQFAAGEQLDEHNAWYCSNCKRHVCALKLITLWNTPDVLIFHLKRFTFEECPDVDGKILRRKIEDTVNFPIDRLDMTEYILGPVDPNAPPIYKLFGVSEHTGTTANSGHYTATVRNSEDGNWYRYNDSNVGFTSGDAAITGGAYLLFYQRIKGSLRWAGMENELSGTPSVDEDGFQAVVGKRKKNRR